MMRHALGKVLKVHQKILSGEVAAFPYRRKQESGCDYCAYRHICGFDQKIPGYQYRDIFEMTQSGGDSSHGSRCSQRERESGRS